VLLHTWPTRLILPLLSRTELLLFHHADDAFEILD
jgi:hypothetical protein